MKKIKFLITFFIMVLCSCGTKNTVPTTVVTQAPEIIKSSNTETTSSVVNVVSPMPSITATPTPTESTSFPPLPSLSPTAEPTNTPNPAPTEIPILKPSTEPYINPTPTPSIAPTPTPTPVPTPRPTEVPSEVVSNQDTETQNTDNLKNFNKAKYNTIGLVNLDSKYELKSWYGYGANDGYADIIYKNEYVEYTFKNTNLDNTRLLLSGALSDVQQLNEISNIKIKLNDDLIFDGNSNFPVAQLDIPFDPNVAVLRKITNWKTLEIPLYNLKQNDINTIRIYNNNPISWVALDWIQLGNEIVKPKAYNLSSDSIVTASSTSYEAYRLLKYINDNNIETGWGSGGYPLAWVNFDLKSSKNISSIRFLPLGKPAGTVYFDIMGSNDNINFELIKSETANTTEDNDPNVVIGTWSNYPINTEKTFRYIRFVCRDWARSWVGIREIEIFGY